MTTTMVNAPVVGRWALKSVIVDPGESTNDKARRALTAGWEPFQVLAVNEGREIWFRRYEAPRQPSSAPLVETPDYPGKAGLIRGL